jgi:hypothetical protein
MKLKKKSLQRMM